MKLSRTVGLAVAVSLVAGAVAALGQISGAALADPTANVVDAAGHLRVPADYRTLYQALGRRVGMVVVRRRQAAQDYLYRLPHRLPGMPRARQGHRLDLRERISRPASLGGRVRRRSSCWCVAEATVESGKLVWKGVR